MSTAVLVRTESSDEYLFSFNEKLTLKQVKVILKEKLKDEYEYISEIKIATSKDKK